MTTWIVFLESGSLALVCGLVFAYVYSCQYPSSSSFLTTLAILPFTVMAVMMAVNGNLGASVAVAGSFSLVRFRSLPGKASDILAIFATMTMGLLMAMNLWIMGILFTLCMVVALLIMEPLIFRKQQKEWRKLKITIPEDLDYSDIFDDILQQYMNRYTLVEVKTTNLGSLYQLCFDVVWKDLKKEKQCIDAMRCRNGNLPIVSCKEVIKEGQL